VQECSKVEDEVRALWVLLGRPGLDFVGGGVVG